MNDLYTKHNRPQMRRDAVKDVLRNPWVRAFVIIAAVVLLALDTGL